MVIPIKQRIEFSVVGGRPVEQNSTPTTSPIECLPNNASVGIKTKSHINDRVYGDFPRRQRCESLGSGRFVQLNLQIIFALFEVGLPQEIIDPVVTVFLGRSISLMAFDQRFLISSLDN